MFSQTIIITLVMLFIFVVGSIFRKIPISLFLILAAILAAIIGGFGIPLDYLVEGTQVFLYLILIVAAGMLFMGVIKASGALDALTYTIVAKFYNKPIILLPLLMFLIMLPAMLTGSAPAAVLSTGVLVAPILMRLGIPKVETAAILALGSTYGLVAPPINVPAMIIATGVYMPYEGFYTMLILLSFPLAIFSVLFLGLKHIKSVKLEEILEKIPYSTKEKNIIIYLPLIVVVIIMVGIRAFPEIFLDVGTPLVFLIGTIIAIFTGRRMNFITVSKESMKDSIPILSIFVSVGILIEIMALTGVRGLLVLASLSLGGALLYLSIALFVPLLGGPLMPFGVAGVLGVPLVLAFIGKNTIIVTSAITLIISIGCLIPPTAIGGLFAARVVGVERYSEILRKTLIPSILTIIIGLFVLIFSGSIEKILF